MSIFKADTEQSGDLYAKLAEHQQDPHWDGHPDICEKTARQEVFAQMHRWVRLFVLQFKLEIPNVAIGIDSLRSAHGHYSDCNSFGLHREIVLDVGHIAGDEPHDVLGTLLHELLHAWQRLHGSPGRPGPSQTKSSLQ